MCLVQARGSNSSQPQAGRVSVAATRTLAMVGREGLEPPTKRL